jgi:hypothetical protein
LLSEVTFGLQVYHGHSSRDGNNLEIHLRSDTEALSAPLHVRVPTVWLLGSSAAASRKLMSALGQHSPAAKPATSYLTPAEVVMDGAKWCNLLAAPVTTPNLAFAALTTALPFNAGAWAGSQGSGPIRMASQLVQVIHLPRLQFHQREHNFLQVQLQFPQQIKVSHSDQLLLRQTGCHTY